MNSNGLVTFVAMQLPDRIQVRVDPARDCNLLDLAVHHDIPLPCDCKQGNCGSCAVKVARLHAAPQMTRLTEKERYYLLKVGKITVEQFYNEYLPDRPALWRLACEYQMTDEQIMVAF